MNAAKRNYPQVVELLINAGKIDTHTIYYSHYLIFAIKIHNIIFEV